MDAMQALMERTSYRGGYRGTPVPRADLERIMQAGLAAPSGCNLQTTSLIAVDEPALIARLRAVLKAPVGKTAPAMILVLTKRLLTKDNQCFCVQDYSAAIQNILLACVALGYQSCWVEGDLQDDDIARRMADILDVPQDYELVCVLPVGVAMEPLRHVSKKAFDERAWFNGFSNKNG